MTTPTHPLEDTLGMEPEYFVRDIETGDVAIRDDEMPQIIQPPLSSASPQPDIKDADDIQIETDMDEIYDEAMIAFRQQTQMVETMEPRYSARNAEVAAQYLKIALDSREARAKTKVDRRRSNTFVPYANTSNKTINNTNLVVADRNAILDMLREQDKIEKK